VKLLSTGAAGVPGVTPTSSILATAFKRLVVSPGAQLLLQRHFHRAEHWIVVRGTAEVTLGDATHIVHENESIFIPIGAVHRLANPGRIPLEVIEVQTGSYLGEDDIVRLEDRYHRLIGP
jgi:mannose-1-phosphate guanylyltransferase/mannose-6-phosphate isomerase